MGWGRKALRSSRREAWRVSREAARLQRGGFTRRCFHFLSSDLLLNLPRVFMPPQTHPLETAFNKVTIEHYVPVSSLSVCLVSYKPSRPALRPGDHAHFAEAHLPPLSSLSEGLSSLTSSPDDELRVQICIAQGSRTTESCQIKTS